MIIETERLILRPFQEGDEDDVFEYLHEPEVNCFAGMRLNTIDDAKDSVKNRLSETEYYFAISLKDSDKVIGEIEAYPEPGEAHADEYAPKDTFSPCWMLNREYQGKGYAFEAAYAFYDYLFKEKGARRIYAYTEDNNIPSQHLCEKLGMRKEGLFKEFISFVDNPDGTPRYENTIQYAILKKEWEEVVRIHRIRGMEDIFDRALSIIAALDESSGQSKSVTKEIETLIAYYESDLWREDFEADEEGRLPADLKRGVLSEDGIYNLLTDYQRLTEQ